MKPRKIDPFDIHCLLGCACVSLPTAFAISLATYRDYPELSLPDFFVLLLIHLGMMLLIAGICFAICVLICFIFKYVDRPAIKTAFALWGNRISQNIRSKNADRIAPWLRLFLFTVLSRNVEVLPLTLGRDMTCLTPYGFGTVFRKGCLLYRFQLVTKDFPDLSETDVQQLLNQFVMAELNNYGIVGLPSLYQDAHSYVWSSVYVDRVMYDRPNNLINFELLYTASESDVIYRRQAISRDNPQPTAEAAVYDDEI